MKCDAFETRLNDLLDARAPFANDAVLIEHAARCGECRAKLASYVDLFSGVQQLERPTCSGELAERVLAELRGPATVSFARHRRWAPWYALAAAAALLLVAWPLVDWKRSSPSTDVARVESVDTATWPGALVEANEVGEVVSLDELLRDASNKYAALASQTRDHVTVPSVEAVPTRAPATSQDPAVQALTTVSWMQGVSDGLKPLAESTSGAFSFLLQAFNTTETPTRS